MQKTSASPEDKVAVEAREALKKRAAKQAHKRELAPDDVPIVNCTVMPHGDGKISMGQHIAGLGEVHFEEGETFPCALPTAVQHYVRGWVNFEGAKEAVADFKLGQARSAAADRASQEALDKLLAQAV